MTTRNWFTGIAIAALLIGTAACTKKTEQTPAPTSTQAGTAHDQHKEVWTCPMHPQIRKDGPGRCPICGMDLVKVEKEETPQAASSATVPHEHAPIQLSPAKQQMIGVKRGKVEKKKLFKEIRAAGRVAFDPELYTAQSEYQEALKQLARVKDSPLPDVRHSAQRMVESSKLRLKILGLSDKQIANLGTSQKTESDLLLHKAGEDVWVYAEVYEMDLPNVTPGLEVKITATFLQGRTLTGKVVSVDRVINTATRTAKVRITVPKAKLQLRPETYVDALIFAPLGEQIAVPFDAILDTGKEAWVYIAGENGHLTPQKITVKFYSGDWVAIESGLQGGETIVTSANFLVDSESRLRATSIGEPVAGTHEHD